MTTKKHSGYKGVCPLRNKWQASICYQSKQQYLGLFETIEEAIEIRKLAETHKKQGDLLEWLDNYRREKQDLEKMNSLRGDVPSKISKSGQKWIYRNDNMKWSAIISFSKKQHYLGSFNTVDEAVAVRRLAADHIKQGDFLEWLTDYKQEKRSLARKTIVNGPSSRSKSGYAGIRAIKKKWQSNIYYHCKQHCLGTFDTIEEAIAERGLAADHIQQGDFLEWLSEKRK